MVDALVLQGHCMETVQCDGMWRETHGTHIIIIIIINVNTITEQLCWISVYIQAYTV